MGSTVTPMPKGIRFAIDRGGTFTDVWAAVEGQPDIVLKLLSVDPENYADAPSEGIRRVLEHVTQTSIPRSAPLPKEHIESIRMGTTVATNALLERKGKRHAFVVTEGFRDLLDIGHQSRPKLFALDHRKPETLYDEVVEISERVTVEDFEDRPEDLALPSEGVPGTLVEGTTGDILRIIKAIDADEVREQLLAVQRKGTDAIAICFAHSYLYPAHEETVAKIAMELGFSHVSASSTVGSKMIKMVPRGSSASADAYLTPKIQQYVSTFAKGFEGGNLDGVNCEFMQSDGGLVNYKYFTGLKAILSGPAGGVVGYARTSYDGKTPVVGFDMGGTSTDVSRYGGDFEHVLETTTAGVAIQSPQLDINTVAAGGGSILFWENGLFKVGPGSAGAHPGPASYRKGGPLTVTDANLMLGRLLPEYFPAIFGPNEDLPLDVEVVRQRFAELTKSINADTGRSLTPMQVASGFIDVANEAMGRPIRAITEARGHDTSAHNLAVFGGAGGQHACELARKLDIKRVIVHKFSSILSAYGMALAEVVQEMQEPSSEILSDQSTSRIQQRVLALELDVKKKLLAQDIKETAIRYDVYLHLRYQGTETQLMILQPADGNFRAAFEREHLRELAFLFPATKDVLVDDIRVRGVGASGATTQDSDCLVQDLKETMFVEVDTKIAAGKANMYFKGVGYQMSPVYRLEQLKIGNIIKGPALIIDNTQTIIITPDAKASILTSHVIIDLDGEHEDLLGGQAEMVADPVQLSVYSHRFMGIAEQMGRTLQRTSLSLNIKERLDFSCAIFGPDAELVANAPHVPVHLGSMSYAVKYQAELHKGNLRPGDVLVSNHPESGGTHLPDITVITPVFEPDGKTICFYTASRGHHMDIGGLNGTSMPPDSTCLDHEGAAIQSFFLVRDEKFDEDGICKILLEPGTREGCTGSMRLGDNISDLKAQIAANNKGSSLIQNLMAENSKQKVHFYMKKIQGNAEIAVRNYLKAVRAQRGDMPLTAEDYMDNGSIMRVSIIIDEDGTGVYDFAGTSCEMLSNMNAPPAITYSALIYCMRVLIGSDIPLNQGCLTPTKVLIPKNTFLNPSASRAVCCGNTLTSQRVTDLLLKAFHAAAASQGCMNCMGFFGRGAPGPDGNPPKGFAYNYGETIAGGAGAGPTFHGASGLHTHMTNTRTTDAEIMERRYPILVREFSIRKGSGGRGKYNGGDGVVRDFECRAPLTFSMISERRVNRPYGMAGGEPGQRGANYWVQRQKDGSQNWLNIGPRGQIDMQLGDRFVVHTPGGGAWGRLDDEEAVKGSEKGAKFLPRANGSVNTFFVAQLEA
ncbi:Hydantoinase B/oxoprolinase-domain-containing protein [Aspergillus stella-maris]|uniref:Hydantoinase B/oxoprolinase-domain-containing protein n=1 Tax=Aspergillus stella-maris TaxID=1810926 RepID=UPI003CCE0855